MAREKSSISLKNDGVSSNWIAFSKAQNKNPHFKLPAGNTPRNRGRKNKGETATAVVALDCEMVSDRNGDSMLARVSIVDYNLSCIYDEYVKPTSPVGDYRTRVSGIRPEDIENGEDFKKVQQEVRNLLYNKILVGHGLIHDFKVLQFRHHFQLLRDTSTYPPFQKISNGKRPSLKRLVQHFLNESIQEGEHCSIQDAAAAMQLYKKFNKDWEAHLVRSSRKRY